jgi:hypothetical protein
MFAFFANIFGYLLNFLYELIRKLWSGNNIIFVNYKACNASNIN